jgi:hypothetical protein
VLHPFTSFLLSQLVEVSLPLHLIRVGLKDVLWVVARLSIEDQEFLSVLRDLQ